MSSPALDQAPYTITNLPYGVISTKAEPRPRCAIAIGQHALDLKKYAESGKLSDLESGHNFKYEKVFAEVGSVAPTGVDLLLRHHSGSLISWCSLL